MVSNFVIVQKHILQMHLKLYEKWKIAILKKAESTFDFIGNKIVDKITSKSKNYKLKRI